MADDSKVSGWTQIYGKHELAMYKKPFKELKPIVSDHIEKILSILSKVKHVEEGRGNILLSDFKINLQELSLNGIVGNLKALYLAPGGSGFSVLDEFNQLEFLSDIAVRNYERNEDTR